MDPFETVRFFHIVLFFWNNNIGWHNSLSTSCDSSGRERLARGPMESLSRTRGCSRSPPALHHAPDGGGPWSVYASRESARVAAKYTVRSDRSDRNPVLSDKDNDASSICPSMDFWWTGRQAGHHWLTMQIHIMDGIVLCHLLIVRSCLILLLAQTERALINHTRTVGRAMRALPISQQRKANKNNCIC
jgi:hypothetical protein